MIDLSGIRRLGQATLRWERLVKYQAEGTYFRSASPAEVQCRDAPSLTSATRTAGLADVTLSQRSRVVATAKFHYNKKPDPDSRGATGSRASVVDKCLRVVEFADACQARAFACDGSNWSPQKVLMHDKALCIWTKSKDHRLGSETVISSAQAETRSAVRDFLSACRFSATRSWWCQRRRRLQGYLKALTYRLTRHIGTPGERA